MRKCSTSAHAGGGAWCARISRLERQGYPVPLPFYHKALPNDKLSRALRAVFRSNTFAFSGATRS